VLKVIAENISNVEKEVAIQVQKDFRIPNPQVQKEPPQVILQLRH
jgi:hypothetical protein